MKRVVVLCPGRGSYGRDSLRSLRGLDSPRLDQLDQYRISMGRPTIREMDAADKFQSKLHLSGENASILTAGITLADLDQLDQSKVSVVGVVGNSMGWYTALGVAGALSMDDCARLIETMAHYQVGNIVGGQVIYPFTDEDWRLNPALEAQVEAAVAQIPELYWSIRLGGQAVLGGTEAALKAAAEVLPAIQRGSYTFPLRLPMHSAFHTPMMAATSEKAQSELADLGWRAPTIPLVDGRGKVLRPRHADPSSIRDYTLGAQITETFDLTTCVRVALRTFGPDAVVLPGPGHKLGSAVAQTMIAEGWNGLHNANAFVARQDAEPILLSMRWRDQRSWVVA
jgi:[acyl-carrier-protein] S-malonyltransferase